MSRIDEDRSERRIEEARQAERRSQERVKKEKTDQASAFDRALAQRAGEQTATQKSREPEKPKDAPKPDARPKDAPKPQAPAKSPARPEQPLAERGGRLVQERGAAQARQEAADKSSLAGRAEARPSTEAKDTHESSSSGSSSSDEALASRAEGKETAASGKKGQSVRRADDDDRGGEKGKDQGKKEQALPFRLPPAALMAPPPVARPKDTAGRLGGLTKEIVDKIVSRVLVGTNSQGVPEFRLELKSSVLKGLSIKVSGRRGGKIRAVFSGSDKEVLEALKEHSSDLVDALSARGLTLEDLVFEDNA